MLSAREKKEEEMIKKALEGQEDIDPKKAFLLAAVIIIISIAALALALVLYVPKG